MCRHTFDELQKDREFRADMLRRLRAQRRRDACAMFALQGVLSRSGSRVKPLDMKKVARECYKWADAMAEARDRVK